MFFGRCFWKVRSAEGFKKLLAVCLVTLLWIFCLHSFELFCYCLMMFFFFECVFLFNSSLLHDFSCSGHFLKKYVDHMLANSGISLFSEFRSCRNVFV